MRKLIAAAAAILLAVFCAKADNIRVISSHEGISNNAVLAMSQDSNGRIWLGTCDGLNMWDGNRMRVYPYDWEGVTDLSGRFVGLILKASDGKFIIRTNFGVDIFDPTTLEVKGHPEITGKRKIAASDSKHIVIISPEGLIRYYDSKSDSFLKLKNPPKYDYNSVIGADLSEDGILSVYDRDEGIRRFRTQSQGGSLELKALDAIKIDGGIGSFFSEGSKSFIFSAQGILYEYDLSEGSISYVYDLSSEILQRGWPSEIMRSGEDIIVTYSTTGALRLRFAPLLPERYVKEATGIKCGVFCAIKDERQDIVWIGTDGDGLIQLYRSPYEISSISFRDIHKGITMPVRSIHHDREGNLWFGTKGDGAMMIPDYDCKAPAGELGIRQFNSNNSEISENSIYTFEESSHNLLWIGNNSANLNYYSYADHRIHTLPSGGRFNHVHALYESAPDSLWITSSGGGVFLATLSGGSNPQITDVKSISLGDEFKDNPVFFAMHPQDRNTLWFGHRGHGAAKYSIKEGKATVYDFAPLGKAVYDDVFAITSDSTGCVWFGTGDGVIRMKDTPEAVEGIRGSIHAMTNDGNGNIWASGNNGLYRISIDKGIVEKYDYSCGMETVEFSDGAVFKDHDGAVFFGGIDGLVRVDRTGYVQQDYHPQIEFLEMTVNGKTSPVSKLLRKGRIVLRHKQKLTKLTFGALDYVNGKDYVYRSRVSGYSSNWRENGQSIDFADLRHGNHTVDVIYRNNSTGYESPATSLKIKVRAAWYSSVIAKIIYLLMLIAAAAATCLSFMRRHQIRKERRLELLKEENRKMQQASMNNIMSDIADELSVPITLINGHCDMILSSDTEDKRIRRDANGIMQNAIRLKNLSNILQNICRKGENKIELVNVSELATAILTPFIKTAKHNSIELVTEIHPGIVWSVDKNACSMAMNLIASFLSQNTQSGGRIGISLDANEEDLVMTCSSSNISVPAETVKEVLESDSIYEYFEKKRGGSGPEEFNIAIFKEMTERSNGTVQVSSSSPEDILFEIRIKKSAALDGDAGSAQSQELVEEYKLPEAEKVNRSQIFDPKKSSLIVTNEGDEISRFIVNVLWDEYNIMAPETLEEAQEMMHKSHPDLVICGGNGKQDSGVKLLNAVKDEKATRHIPVILVFSKSQTEITDEEKSKADACITIPFELDTLKTVLKQLLNRSDVLKDYYKSPLSNYKVAAGKVLHTEDKEFIDRMYSIIADNVSNPDLSPKFIADQMGLSLRNMYRRIENTMDIKPSSVIKEYRLSLAADLLLTSKMTVDEIIYKTGFVNRGTFFRLFTEKYGTTPKKYMKSKQEGVKDIL